MSAKIMPITDLRRNTKKVIQGIKQDGDTVYITQHGRPSVVLIDYAQYEAMQVQLKEKQPTQQQKTVEALLQSWIDDGDEAEQIATGDALIVGLDDSRLSNRPLFPDEMQGKSW